MHGMYEGEGCSRYWCEVCELGQAGRWQGEAGRWQAESLGFQSAEQPECDEDRGSVRASQQEGHGGLEGGSGSVAIESGLVMMCIKHTVGAVKPLGRRSSLHHLSCALPGPGFKPST